MELVETRTLTHKQGLHARASTKFVEIAQQFKSEVFVSKDDHEVDGKSVLGILTLGVELGQDLTLRIAGPDADQAMKALLDLIERDFDGI